MKASKKELDGVVVGDEVAFIGKPGCSNYNPHLAGRVGTVVYINKELCVYWKGLEYGHNASSVFVLIPGFNPASTEYWFVRPDEIEVVGGITENE